MDHVICRERYGRGTTSLKRAYVKNLKNRIEARSDSHRLISLSQFFRSVFLPQGYPESVSDDYFIYQIWDTVQAFCSSITGALAAQAVLKGVGVGDKDATVLAATFTWLIKNGTGMLGQIMFAWIQGVFLDCDCKRWRLFADILNDAAIFLEILAPFFASYFTVVVCVAGLFRSIVSVAGGATRAALTQHQARRNNMADVSAKDGSQETLVNLAALFCNLMLIPWVTGNESLIWTLFILFTSMHLFANYKAVTAVTMATFNQTRLHLVLQPYFASSFQYLLPVRLANLQEPVLWSLKRRLRINLGASVRTLPNSFEELQSLHKIYKDSKYLLYYNEKNGSVNIVLHEESSSDDQMKACFQAEVIEYAISQCNAVYQKLTKSALLQRTVAAAQYGDTNLLLENSYELAETCFATLRTQAIAEGWQMSPILLAADEWRATWQMEGSGDKVL